MMQYLCCRVGNEWYGLAVETGVEVLPFVALTEVPGARDELLGLLRLRDVVMPVVDLRVRFHEKSAEINLDTPIVALRTANGPVAVVVDDVDDVAQVDTQERHDSIYTTGVARLDERLLLLLDVNRLLDEVVLPAT
jgi:purine-binding chemotaxis protein CheW